MSSRSGGGRGSLLWNWGREAISRFIMLLKVFKVMWWQHWRNPRMEWRQASRKWFSTYSFYKQEKKNQGPTEFLDYKMPSVCLDSSFPHYAAPLLRLPLHVRLDSCGKRVSYFQRKEARVTALGFRRKGALFSRTLLGEEEFKLIWPFCGEKWRKKKRRWEEVWENLLLRLFQFKVLNILRSHALRCNALWKNSPPFHFGFFFFFFHLISVWISENFFTN
jgi:hypothetical protein